MKKIDVKLITGRLVEQGIHLENKMSDEYLKAAAVCELNEKDMAGLDIRGEGNVRVKSRFGEVVVRARVNNDNPAGIAFVPMGPWANRVIDPDTGGCGMPHYKGMDAEVSPSYESIPTIRELMEGIK